jgi:pimeloyl-ACP methyl ester carboxylesterase
MPTRPYPVILLPGVVLPAGPAWAALLAELGPEVDARPKELEVYATEPPPVGYSMSSEVAGIARVAEAAGFDRFHLVGYSGGGASCLAYAAEHPERLSSLAVMEPAFAGWQRMTPREREHFEAFRAILDIKPADQMARFQAFQMAPGVAPPPRPDGPQPPWMASRPAGIRAMLQALLTSDLDLAALERFDSPVWYGLGGLSHPHYFALMADRLAGVFPDFTVEVFAHRHHFDPPHRTEPQRVAASLRALWSRAERRPTQASGSAYLGG